MTSTTYGVCVTTFDDSPGMETTSDPPRRALRLLREQLIPALQFLLIGGIAFLIDYLVFNMLVYAAPWPGSHGPMFSMPMPAKLIAIALASVFTYVGNKLWTFSSRQSRVTGRRLAIFVLLNLVAMGIQEACLGVSRYALGFHSWQSDNISGTLIGQALATIFRYVSYRRWVFPDDSLTSSDAGSKVTKSNTSVDGASASSKD